jgi:hypothetical protein
MSKHNLPTEPGLYFATDFSKKTDWPIIVNVYGKVPFLKCDLWNYTIPGTSPFSCIYPDKLYYGPKINEPK